MSRLRPTASCRSTWVNGSSREPKREEVRRTPLATARTMPCWRVSRVMMRSASASLCVRSTMASSLYRGMAPLSPRATTTRWPTRRRSGGGHQRRLGEGEPDLEGRSLAELAGHRDAPAVGVHDGLGDGQPQPDTGDGVGEHRAAPEELVEDLGLLGLGDAATGVADADHRDVTVTSDASLDSAASGCVLDRVAEQVVEDLRQPLTVTVDVEGLAGAGGVEVELDAGRRGGLASLDR